jgi:hypothetical protein
MLLLLLLLQGAYKLDAAAALAGIGLNCVLNAPWRPASAAEPGYIIHFAAAATALLLLLLLRCIHNTPHS